jgi:geranylgeranyl pyrophosphate synthase
MLIVKNTFEKFAVTKSVDNILAKYQKECNKQISQIKNKNIQEVLSILLEYLLERKS